MTLTAQMFDPVQRIGRLQRSNYLRIALFRRATDLRAPNEFDSTRLSSSSQKLIKSLLCMIKFAAGPDTHSISWGRGRPKNEFPAPT